MTTPKRPGTQIWQTNLIWPMDPPRTKSDRQTFFGWWTPQDQIWQMNLLWPVDPLGPEQRCLEYQYTKPGRWTYFGQWTPLGTRAEMPWIPVHKTWQMNLLWLMDPSVPEQTCLEYQYTQLGRWHLVVKNGNFTLLLTSSGQAWQFHFATDV